MSDRDEHRQLDLLGGVSGPGPRGGPREKSERLAVRWADAEGPGRLGCAAWPGSGLDLQEDVAHLATHHRATVLLAVIDDPSELVRVAAELGLDVRHMTPGGERLAQQADALAADLRAGRRTVCVGADASAVALPVVAALIALGKSEAEALAAVGGEAALAERERAALGALIEARAKSQGAWRGVAEALDPKRPRAAPSEAPQAVDRAAPSEAPEAVDRAAPIEGEAEADEAGDDEADDEADDDDDEVDLDRKEATTLALDALFEAKSPPPNEGRRDEETEPARIELAREPAPELEAIARSPRRSRLAGAVLGGAIGDAMGHPTEFIRSFEKIRERFGPSGVTGYELTWERDGKRVAPYTDDTQMAECVLRSLLWGREREADLDATMRDMAQRFVEWSKNPQGGHRAPGNACLAGCRNLERGVSWREAGGPTAGGCGSVMRAYPFGLVFAHDLGRAEEWAVAHSKLTHRDPIALAASAAMAVGVARILRDEPLTRVLSEMVAAACRYSPKTAAMMARAIDEAQEGVKPETTLERLEGWAAHEAIAAAVYVLARHPDDPRAAILEGANTPGDSDSIATLAGALVGARVGVGALPSDWVRDVERSDALLELALAI
jgi:ADP-ribosylglycohydrolase